MSRGTALEPHVELAHTLVAMCQATTTDRKQAIARAAAIVDYRLLQRVAAWSESIRLDQVNVPDVLDELAHMEDRADQDPFALVADHHGYSPNAAMRTAIANGTGRTPPGAAA